LYNDCMQKSGSDFSVIHCGLIKVRHTGTVSLAG